MTCRPMETLYDEAVALARECERLLQDPTADSWDAVHLKQRARDFLDKHRMHPSLGGPV